jgi:hypothetical protein
MCACSVCSASRLLLRWSLAAHVLHLCYIWALLRRVRPFRLVGATAHRSSVHSVPPMKGLRACGPLFDARLARRTRRPGQLLELGWRLQKGVAADGTRRVRRTRAVQGLTLARLR